MLQWPVAPLLYAALLGLIVRRAVAPKYAAFAT
jgi:hypothetical protein